MSNAESGILILLLRCFNDVMGHEAARDYMKLLNVALGLLINFHELKVIDGISRLMGQ